jgi:hypothetical protein
LANIRIVFSFEAKSKELDECWIQYPALAKKSKIIFYHRFTDQTLIEVAKNQLRPLFGESTDKLASEACQLHRDHGWNPGQYNSLLKAMSSIFRKHKEQLKTRSEKLFSGLEKLRIAGKDVAQLEKNVAGQKEELSYKRADADAALQGGILFYFQYTILYSIYYI